MSDGFDIASKYTAEEFDVTIDDPCVERSESLK